MIVHNEKFYSKPQEIIKRLLGIRPNRDNFLKRFHKDKQ